MRVAAFDRAFHRQGVPMVWVEADDIAKRRVTQDTPEGTPLPWGAALLLMLGLSAMLWLGIFRLIGALL